jgi:hypothetical protein
MWWHRAGTYRPSWVTGTGGIVRVVQFYYPPVRYFVVTFRARAQARGFIRISTNGSSRLRQTTFFCHLWTTNAAGGCQKPSTDVERFFSLPAGNSAQSKTPAIRSRSHSRYPSPTTSCRPRAHKIIPKDQRRKTAHGWAETLQRSRKTIMNRVIARAGLGPARL